MTDEDLICYASNCTEYDRDTRSWLSYTTDEITEKKFYFAQSETRLDAYKKYIIQNIRLGEKEPFEVTVKKVKKVIKKLIKA